MAHEDIRTREANKVTCRCMAGNFVLAIFKIGAGILGTSAAMVADGLHSFSDLITDIIVLLGIRLSARPADRGHPYGHGRIETFAALIIAFALILTGFGIMFEGLRAVYKVMHGGVLPKPGLVALAMAFVSIVVKEIMYQYTARVGRRIHSLAVISNAWHHRSDALSSVATLIGIGGAYMLGPKWHVLDPAAAVLVSFFIYAIGFKIAKETFEELTDSALPPQTIEKIKETCLTVPGIIGPHKIRTRRIGRRIAISMHVKMPAGMAFVEVHDKMNAMEKCIKKEFGHDTFILIHPEPASPN